jgi:hypothetical protein
MNELYPIIRRKRRPLSEPEVKSVVVMPPAPAVKNEVSGEPPATPAGPAVPPQASHADAAEN